MSTFLRRGVSGFSVFLRSTKGQANLKGLAVAARGKALGKQWRALTAAQRAEFVRKGAKQIVRVAYATKERPPRKLTAYNKFIKANYSKVASLPFNTRLKALAKLFKATA